MIVTMLQRAARLTVRATSVGQTRGAHITRYAMYDRLGTAVAQIASADRAGRVLAISGSRPLCERLGVGGEIVEADYPAYDMLGLPFSDGEFDAVVSDQVLEHVAGDPFAAVAESVRVVRSGGLVLHTSCLIMPIHAVPGDFWRFTPDGMATVCGDAVEVIESGGWGNRLAWVAAAIGLRWLPVPNGRWHPLHRVATWNEPEWPITTWVLGRKR